MAIRQAEAEEPQVGSGVRELMMDGGDGHEPRVPGRSQPRWPGRKHVVAPIELFASSTQVARVGAAPRIRPKKKKARASEGQRACGSGDSALTSLL